MVTKLYDLELPPHRIAGSYGPMRMPDVRRWIFNRRTAGPTSEYYSGAKFLRRAKCTCSDQDLLRYQLAWCTKEVYVW